MRFSITSHSRAVMEAEASGIEPVVTEWPFAIEVDPMELLGQQAEVGVRTAVAGRAPPSVGRP